MGHNVIEIAAIVFGILGLAFFLLVVCEWILRDSSKYMPNCMKEMMQKYARRFRLRIYNRPDDMVFFKNNKF